MPESSTSTALKEKDFTFTGQFDRGKLTKAYLSEMKGAPKFDAKSLTAFEDLVTKLERDKDIRDIRWMAYMLATAHWETAAPVKQQVPALDKKGRALTDKRGVPIMKALTSWRTLTPVSESGHGKGRRYELAVKVTEMKDGSARVVEQDGDEFTVAGTGASKLLKRGAGADAKQGVLPTSVVSATYTQDTGRELAFYGRGLVQLTWWENYAKTGAAAGLGLKLLFEPDLALDPDIAYKIMSVGMRTGVGFANGRKLVSYIQGIVCNYDGARAIINGKDRQKEITAIAQRFERVLLQAKDSDVAPILAPMVLP